jgi:hypothetical protein
MIGVAEDIQVEDLPELEEAATPAPSPQPAQLALF